MMFDGSAVLRTGTATPMATSVARWTGRPLTVPGGAAITVSADKRVQRPVYTGTTTRT